jgi:uncharacterized membrane protein YfcA
MNGIEHFVVFFVTFVISALTLMTGFGVGTVLTPTFVFFFDIKTAVFLVAVVHLSNNFLKFALFAKHMQKEIFLRFGVLSLAGAVIGSLLYGTIDATLLTILLALFLIVVGGTEFLPVPALRFPPSIDMAGGFLSGLMGGLIGNQGAIRSAYLLNYNLSKEAFIGTATAISLVVDLTRIPVYLYKESDLFFRDWSGLVVVILVAFAGTLVGQQLLKKLPLERFRLIVAGFVLLLGIWFLIQSLIT